MRTLCEVEDQQVNYIEFWPLASEEDCLSFFYKGTKWQLATPPWSPMFCNNPIYFSYTSGLLVTNFAKWFWKVSMVKKYHNHIADQPTALWGRDTEH